MALYWVPGPHRHRSQASWQSWDPLSTGSAPPPWSGMSSPLEIWWETGWSMPQGRCADLLAKCGEMGTLIVLLTGRKISTATMGKSMKFPQEIKNRISCNLEILLLGIVSEKNLLSQINIYCCPHVPAALFTIIRHTNSLSLMNKERVVHIQWNISHKRRNLAFWIWMDLQAIVLNEIS